MAIISRMLSKMSAAMTIRLGTIKAASAPFFQAGLPVGIVGLLLLMCSST